MKVPEPRKLSSGDYYIYLRLGGKGIPVQDASKKSCIARATEIKARYKAGELEGVKPKPKRPDAITLRSLLDAYMEKYEPVLSPATYRGYDDIRSNRFQDYMDIPLCDIDDWQTIINAELPTISPKTMKNSWALVSAAYRKILKMEPPDVQLAKVPVKEIPWLWPDEILPFCKAMEGRNGEIAALLELHGLRASEVGGLDWKDIDLSHNIINVRGALVRGKGGWVFKETNKNKQSSRPVPIMIPRLGELLKAEKQKDGPVSTVTQSCVYENIHRACKEAGVTVVGNHGLRHSFASLGYHIGLSEREIQELGGWDDINTMHKIYIRISQKDQMRAAEKIAGFFSAGG